MAMVIVTIAALYLAVGGAFAIYFCWWGAGHVDPGVGDASWRFRLLLAPGAAALWPILLSRLWRRSKGGREP